MDAKLQEYCNLISENREIIKHVALFDFGEMELLGALMFTGEGKKADLEGIKACKPILKEHMGFFSNFRGILEEVVMYKMYLSGNPAEYIEGVGRVYAKLTEDRFFKDEYMVLAAMNIYEQFESAQYDVVCEGVNEAIRAMKVKHPWITDSADMTMAALLCAAGDPAKRILDAEACQEILKERFKFAVDTVQSVSQVLAISDKPAEEKCAAFVSLYEACKDAKVATNHSKEMAIYAAFADVDVPQAQIVADIIDAEAWLKTQKGFSGIFGPGPSMRKMFAATLVLYRYTKGANAASGTTSAAAVAQVVATEIVITIIILMIIIMINSSHNN